jgi:hypothetical protein
MNIFVTDKSPILSAIALDDKRLVKMFLETGQLMSTALNVLFPDHGKSLYKTNHLNHPCSKWVRESRANFKWLQRHFVALYIEYKHRFGKDHKTWRLRYEMLDVFTTKWVSNEERTPFVNCTEFKDIQDVVEAYRLQMIKKWKNDNRPPKWTKRNVPSWVL